MYTDYELFVAIVEEGSLAQAARSLNLSRPVVTKRLQRLEDKLGVMLLHRTTRRVLTTREGQSFYDEIKPVILAAKMAESNIAALKRPQSDRRLRGEIKIRTVNSIARNLLGPVLFSFSRMHPDVRINILVFDQPIDLLSDKVDAEITFAPPSWQGAVLETLALDRRILCASPSYLAEKGTPGSIEDLHRHAIVASPISMPWRLKGPGETPFFFHGKTALLTNSSELPGILAIAGMGIALRPVWAMMHELRDGRLVRVLPEYESDSHWAIRVATSTDRPKTPALQAFLAHMKEEFSGLDAQVAMELASLGHK
jgi:DNA-binding transcriptional LysR family regulator